VKAAQAGLTKLEKAAAERAEETRIVSDAAATVEGEITRHAREHSGDLWTELRDDAAKVAEALTAAVEGVRVAHGDYVQAATRSAELLRLTDRDALRTTRIPDPPPALAEFIRHHDVGRAIQPPLPMHQQATISAEEMERLTEQAGLS
jgi:hypothetical protein